MTRYTNGQQGEWIILVEVGDRLVTAEHSPPTRCRFERGLPPRAARSNRGTDIVARVARRLRPRRTWEGLVSERLRRSPFGLGSTAGLDELLLRRRIERADRILQDRHGALTFVVEKGVHRSGPPPRTAALMQWLAARP